MPLHRNNCIYMQWSTTSCWFRVRVARRRLSGSTRRTNRERESCRAHAFAGAQCFTVDDSGIRYGFSASFLLWRVVGEFDSAEKLLKFKPRTTCPINLLLQSGHNFSHDVLLVFGDQIKQSTLRLKGSYSVSIIPEQQAFLSQDTKSKLRKSWEVCKGVFLRH